jgi:hypothetical protein
VDDYYGSSLQVPVPGRQQQQAPPALDPWESTPQFPGSIMHLQSLVSREQNLQHCLMAIAGDVCLHLMPGYHLAAARMPAPSAAQPGRRCTTRS